MGLAPPDKKKKMEFTTDIAIIGNGLAAYAAALEVQDSGREVCVVAKAPGASALNSGAWDAADNPVRPKGETWPRLLSIRLNVEEILRRFENHPYSVLARMTPPGGFADFLLGRMARAAQALPLPMHYRGEANLLLPSEMGTLKPSAFVQASMAESDLSAMDRAKVLVVGILGYPQFNSRFLRASILEQQEQQGELHVEFAGHLDVEIPQFKSKASLTGVEIAQGFDQEGTAVNFAEQILKYLEGKVYTHLLLPPVLGLENTAAILTTLRRITGLKAAETLATPMSVPGYRLMEATAKFFQGKGIRTLDGEVVGYDSEGRKVTSLRIHDRERRIRLQAKGVVLATGKFIGGGVRREGRFYESIFHLPLSCDGRVLAEQTVQRASHPEAAARQPYLGAGVAINPRCQPLDADGGTVFDNLFAAGAVLADFDPAHERCAAGVSIASGTIAGRGARESI